MRIRFSALLLLIGCAPLTPRPPAQRVAIETAFTGKKVYAQCALYRGWFWDDPTRDLLAPHPVDHRIWVLNRKGDNVPTRPRLRRVQPGSIWFVERVSHPIGVDRLKRPLMSPRHLTWIHLRKGSSLAIVPVPENVVGEASVRIWFENQFGASAPTALNTAPPAHRQALKQGRILAGMGAEEVEAALCKPDQIWRDQSVSPPVEKWIYLNQTGDHLAAVFLAGKATGQTIRMTQEAYEALPRSEAAKPATPQP
ncbi:MAG: hypothetical protein CMH55_11275 [Myxococcales bacterium]|nr:hypothetical protein [Myxococcales bacterium]